ncbi:serine/threonine-protein kinase [Actinoplanes sp. NEAU-A12]|uniref:non-specific serine/threonine protein kinase n=1 Tax=Actinoplanes sandaracinus TaxID=3045177 RepID=A0ABT6X1S8_9ACTN|nr:serine/threonine-protein kinase [Actinoplanes sandaracinus]MDI6105986.1 serine/threonine-protein kinase [Actinoplanes sandaracinus]
MGTDRPLPTLILHDRLTTRSVSRPRSRSRQRRPAGVRRPGMEGPQIAHQRLGSRRPLRLALGVASLTLLTLLVQGLKGPARVAAVSTSEDVSEQADGLTPAVLVGGRYRLLQRLGSGGMGVVWLAVDEVLRRRVAIKELHLNWGSSDQTIAAGRERSLREARAAAALHHRNIVAVYDIVDHDGRPWIVMERVVGRSLKDVVVEDGPLPVERAVAIGLQLLSALQAAHAAGITHRDVKPANVLVSDGDVVRLTDFGLAAMADDDSLTATGAMLGTLGYLAPEQANGLAPGPPADVFGCAATLYYAVEGVGPFHRDEYLPMLAAYARHDIRVPQRAQALTPVLLRLLSADPAKRPTVEQACELLLGGNVRQRWVSRRLLLAAGGAGVVAAGVGVVLRPDAGSRPSTAPSVSPRPLGVGRRLWEIDDARPVTSHGSRLVVANWQYTEVRGVDAATGRQQWRLESSPPIFNPDVDEGLLLLDDGGKTGNGYRVIEVATGTQRASFNIPAATGAAGGLVLAQPWKSPLAAHDAANGRQRWTARIDGELGQHVVTGADDLLIASVQKADSQRWLYGLRRKSGVIVWKHRLSAAGSIEAMWGTREHVYAATVERGELALVVLAAQTGVRLSALPLTNYEPDTDPSEWQVRVSLVGTAAGLLVAVGDPRAAGEHSGIIAIEGAGTVRWRRQLLDPTMATTDEGRLFAGTDDSVLHELDPATGQTLWSTPTPGPAGQLFTAPDMLMALFGGTVVAYDLGSSGTSTAGNGVGGAGGATAQAGHGN